MMTIKDLKSNLSYNRDTGIFIWIKSPHARIKINSIAGCFDKLSYRRLRINNKSYLAHRLAWFYVYGYMPKIIDHINKIPSDNRLINLREVTHRKNCQNFKIHRNGHLAGTSFCKKYKKWLFQIRVNYKTVHIGYYNTEQEAHEAYLNHKENI